MSSNSSLGPLSAGNVVSAGLRIYRDNFKSYYRLALNAGLWSFIPVYGWAKYFANAGLISRLAYSQVIERPETVNEARKYTQPRMWKFLLVSLSVGFILLGVLAGGLIFFGIIFAILATILGNSPISIPIITLLGIIAFVIFVYGYIWLYSRLSLVELPIAIEDNLSLNTAINRSWNLTKNSVGRIQLVFLLTSAIVIPLIILLGLIFMLERLFLALLIPSQDLLALVVSLLDSLVNIAINAVILPLFQSIKAVIYYDMRNRREGINLGISDRHGNV